MKMWSLGYPAAFKDDAFSNTYFKAGYPGLITGFDSSRTKVGKQMTKNWGGSVLSQVKVHWSNEQISQDKIRGLLKSS